MVLSDLRRNLTALRAVGALAIVGLAAGLAGCGDTSDPSVIAAGQANPESLRLQAPVAVVVDDAGVPWALDRQDAGLLVIVGGSDGIAEARLDPGAGERQYGVQMFPFGEGVALARVVCGDLDCEDANLTIDRFELVDGAVEQSTPSWSSEPFGQATAVTTAGAGENAVAVTSGRKVLVVKADGVEESEMPATASNVCLVDDQLVAVEYEGDTSQKDPAKLPDGGAVNRGQLVDLTSGEQLPDSDFSYSVASQLEPRCGRSGVELAQLGQPASQVWSGSPGGWTESTSGSVDWTLPPAGDDAFGLVGVIQEELVRLDSASGERLSFVSLPDEVRTRWAEATEQSLPVTDFVALGRASDPVALVCYVQRAGDADQAEVLCDSYV